MLTVSFLDKYSDYIILLGSIIVISIILLIVSKNKPTFIQDHIKIASKETQFGSTYFEIYDKTNKEGICNRLIIVKPFEWQFWAKDGKIYILVDTNFKCPPNYTPAALVPNTIKSTTSSYEFKSVCIHILLEDIISSYTSKIIPVKITFDIQKLQQQLDQFTIIDALNYLLKGYLTMDSPSKDTKIYDTNAVINHKLINHALPERNVIGEIDPNLNLAMCYEKLNNHQSICTLTNTKRGQMLNTLSKRNRIKAAKGKDN